MQPSPWKSPAAECSRIITASHRIRPTSLTRLLRAVSWSQRIGSFSGHQERQRSPFRSVAHENVVQVDFWDLSLLLNCCDSPPFAFFPGCYVYTNGGTESASSRVQFFLAVSVVEDRACPWSSSLRTPPLHPASSAPLTPHAQHRPPVDPRHACFRSCFNFCFGLTAFTNFLRTLVRPGRLKTESVFGLSNFTVFVDLVPARAISLIGILGPMLVFSMYDSCGPNTTTFPSSTTAFTEANSLFTSVSKNFMLHFFPELQSHVSFHMHRTTAHCRQPHRLRRLCPRNTLLSDRPDALGSTPHRH